MSGLMSKFGFGSKSVTNKPKIEINNFAVQMTQRLTMPDEEYIRRLAKNYGLDFGNSIPLLWKDLYTLFKAKEQYYDEFKLENHLYTITDILDLSGLSNLSPEQQKYYEQSVKFLKKIDFENVPGETPMIQTFNLLGFMVTVQNKATNNTPEDALILQDYIKKVDDALINKTVEKQFYTDQDSAGGTSYGDYVSELSKSLESNIRSGLYDLSPVAKTIIQENPDKSIPVNTALLKMIRIRAMMDKKLGEALGSTTEKELNNNTNTRESRLLTSVSQSTKASLTQKMMPNFQEKVIKKELAVKTKVAPKKSKQSAIFALDDSGSMATLFKQSYVRAILLKLLEDVVNGDMELTFYNYEVNLRNKHVVKTEEEARKLFKHINQRIPNGGGTYIGNCIQTLVDEVIADPELVNPEIFIVCDGEDHVDPKSINFKGVKVNFISLGNYRKEHEQICTLSGGTYLYETFSSKNDGWGKDALRN